MTDENASKPDPMADIAAMDIDALLAKTSALAEKADEQVGSTDGDQADDTPVEEAPTAASADNSETLRETAPSPEPLAQEEQADPVDDADSQLADLEAMLEKVAGNAEEVDSEQQLDGASVPRVEEAESEAAVGVDLDDQVDVDPGQDAAETQDAPYDRSTPTEDDAGSESSLDKANAKFPAAEVSDFEDFDDFDISVDLGEDGEDAATVSKANREADKTGDDAEEPKPRGPLPARVIGGVFGSIGAVFVLLDRPFSGMSSDAKNVIGYVAIATCVMAVGGLLYGRFMVG